MTRAELLAFIRPIEHVVLATVSPASQPEAAVVGIVTTDTLELFFDTSNLSRKCANLRVNPKIAFVIGWDDSQTVQYEGVADEPKGDELKRLKQLYFARFKEGPAREGWPDITYFRVRPTWARYSDFRGAEAKIVEVPVK
jgi:pyridoxine/pyridoxamine 5'-phosphate oxidase